ncbi:MAG: RluA family pseudouridine synthase [Planctomycetota bacterium]
MEFYFTDKDESGQRLDRYLAGHLPEISRSQIKSLIKMGCIRLNGRSAKPKQPLSAGDRVQVSMPDASEDVVAPQDIPLTILYEDSSLLVINKESGMVVHPGPGSHDGTLVNALLFHCDQLSDTGGANRPGIVHRLDKDTSGCLVVAKTDEVHEYLTTQFAERKVSKRYLAAVEGNPPLDAGRIANNIGRHPVNRLRMSVVEPPLGKYALTDYKVTNRMADCALVECRILTGRTHQIRVHFKSMGCPLLGDEVYARPKRQAVPVPRLMLHSWELGFIHPTTGHPMAFSAPIPREFQPFLPSSL